MAEAEPLAALHAGHYGLGVSGVVDLSAGAAGPDAADEVENLFYRALIFAGRVPAICTSIGDPNMYIEKGARISQAWEVCCYVNTYLSQLSLSAYRRMSSY